MEYLVPSIVNALRCPQHSNQISLRKSSRFLNVVLVGSERCIQYSGKLRPSTTRWKFFVFYKFCFSDEVSDTSFLCLHDLRCLVIDALLKIALQRLHFPFDICLVIFSIPPDTILLDNLSSHSRMPDNGLSVSEVTRSGIWAERRRYEARYALLGDVAFKTDRKWFLLQCTHL